MDEHDQLQLQLQRMRRRRDRERAARQEAEMLLESKSRELWRTNQALTRARDHLEAEVDRRTRDLQRSNAQLQVAMEKAEQASRARETFLATMSHEIRTPMNGVLGLARILDGTALDAEQRALMDPLLASAESLLRILDDVLDWSAITAGRLTLSPAPFRPAHLIEESARLFRSTASEKGTTITTTVHPETPLWVDGDAGRMCQIMRNLVGNAVKFTENGHIELGLRPTPDGLMFHVQDDGLGMTRDQLDRVFEAFIQADDDIHRRFGGTGLGLTICQALARRMGGHIDCTSAPAQGTRFVIVVPLPVAAPPDAAASQPAVVAPGTRVLVVDDNPVNRLVALRHLEALGCTAITADNGSEALRRLELEAFDLVLMDIHRPEMDGIRATRLLRRGAAGARAAATPVVGLSADVMEEQRKRCAAAGMNGFVRKPFRVGELVAAIRACRGDGEPPA